MRARRRQLSLAARCRHSVAAPQRRRRPERQRQVESLSRAAAARRDGARPRDPVARARGRLSLDPVGRAGDALARRRARRPSRPGHAAQAGGEPAPGLRGRRLRLRHRSGAAGAVQLRVRPRPGDQARVRLERPGAAAGGAPGRSTGPARADARRRRRVDHPHPAPGELRQHDDPLRRSAEHTGDADAPRADPRLALLRSVPGRSGRAGAPAARRHAHAGAGQRRRGPGRRAPDDSRDRRPRSARRLDRGRLSRRPGVGHDDATAGSRSRCGSTGCFAR